MSFSVECSTSSSHSVLLVVYSHLPIHKWPKAGCDNEFGHKWAPPIHQRVTQSLLHTVHGQLDLASCKADVCLTQDHHFGHLISERKTILRERHML